MQRKIFISINLDDLTKRHIAKKIQPLKQTLPAHWSKPSLYHITILFLGHLEDTAVVDVCTSLRHALKNIMAFSINLDGFAWGPDLDRARMLWLRGNPCASLTKIRQLLADVVGSTNTSTKNIRPHITLAKIKKSKANKQLLHSLEIENLITNISVEVSSIDVMESKHEQGRWNHYLMESIELA